MKCFLTSSQGEEEVISSHAARVGAYYTVPHLMDGLTDGTDGWTFWEPPWVSCRMYIVVRRLSLFFMHF